MFCFFLCFFWGGGLWHEHIKYDVWNTNSLFRLLFFFLNLHQPHPGPDSSISLDPQISNTFMIKAYILFAVTLYLIHDFIKEVHKPGIIWITNAFICIIYVGYAVHWTEDRANWVSMQYMYIIFLNKSEKVYRIFFILIVHTVKVVIYAMGKITQVTQYKSCIWAKNRINVFCTTLNFKFFYIPMH